MQLGSKVDAGARQDIIRWHVRKTQIPDHNKYLVFLGVPFMALPNTYIIDRPIGPKSDETLSAIYSLYSQRSNLRCCLRRVSVKTPHVTRLPVKVN